MRNPKRRFRLRPLARRARRWLGPRGMADDVMGPDGYATGMLFWHGMPEIRHDKRFVNLCARLGLVVLWLATGKWPDCAGDAPYDFKAECEKYRGFPKDAFLVS